MVGSDVGSGVGADVASVVGFLVGTVFVVGCALGGCVLDTLGVEVGRIVGIVAGPSFGSSALGPDVGSSSVCGACVGIRTGEVNVGSGVGSVASVGVTAMAIVGD